jgi:hypothetical protein
MDAKKITPPILPGNFGNNAENAICNPSPIRVNPGIAAPPFFSILYKRERKTIRPKRKARRRTGCRMEDGRVVGIEKPFLPRLRTNQGKDVLIDRS